MNSISYIAHKVDDALRVPQQEDSKQDNTLEMRKDGVAVTKDSESHVHEEDEDEEEEVLLETTGSPEPTEDSSVPYIIHLILFIPNLLIIRPLLFCWFIITYPFTVVEQIRKGSSSPTKDSEITTDDIIVDQEKTSRTSSVDYPNPVSNLIILEMDEAEDERLETDGTTKDANDLKSPTSPSNIILSNPKQFSFPKTVFPMSLVNSNIKKTLILDLDETLVHTLSRGTRMSNGYMVEVKLKDQVATLYSVHKRPYCDLFLKQVSKWYNLVIFTASVKEYADPVIDLLETERKYFLKRFYRNHCTLRDGQGYIKDLTAVDKSLTSMIIIDNSPISYALHENNAIVVEGWINDPSDTDLLNLIPLLDALRYTTDVRPILSLKGGEVAFEG